MEERGDVVGDMIAAVYIYLYIVADDTLHVRLISECVGGHGRIRVLSASNSELQNKFKNQSVLHSFLGREILRNFRFE